MLSSRSSLFLRPLVNSRHLATQPSIMSTAIETAATAAAANKKQRTDRPILCTHSGPSPFPFSPEHTPPR